MKADIGNDMHVFNTGHSPVLLMCRFQSVLYARSMAAVQGTDPTIRLRIENLKPTGVSIGRAGRRSEGTFGYAQ